ncbi:MAG: amidohydrolase [Chloroflexi bacterium]|nr:amidohydrolase [Chloroflexota bacterium]
MIIDLENHLFLEEQVIKGKSQSGRICERYRDSSGEVKPRLFEGAARIEADLKFMDEAGIDMAVLSYNDMLLERCKRWHDFCAGAIQDYPNRFAGFASVPPCGGKPALDELERAVKSLGLKGAHIYARNQGHFLDSKEMWPFYEKVSELGVPIDVHISAAPQGFDALNAPYPLFYVMAREYDMAANVLRLCLGGVLESFPKLVFIMNHFGGGVSAVVERLDAYMSYADSGWSDFYLGRPPINKPWREYFDRLYFSMGGREVGVEAVKCILANVSPRKLMFATDWPFNFDGHAQDVQRFVTEMKKLGLPESDTEAMLGDNAANLLKLP